MSDNYIMKRCCHCNTMAEYLSPSDYANAELKNLDGRPYETDCFSLKTTVMRCPKCGYVSFDISSNILKDEKIIASKEYEDILNRPSLPKEINNFIALGYLYEKQEEYYHASHAYLSGAWLSQDIKNEKFTKTLLKKSALCMLLFINSDKFKERPDLMLLQCAVDVLRQIGEFENSKKLADFSLEKCQNNEVKKVFLLEKSLCENFISTPHAYKAESKAIVSDVDTLIKRFIDAKELSDEEKVQAFNDCFSYVSALLHDKLDNGVEIIFNAQNNKSLNYSEFIKSIKNKTASEENTDAAATLQNKARNAFYSIPKVITKAEDLKEKIVYKEPSEDIDELTIKASDFENETSIEDKTIIENERSVDDEPPTIEKESSDADNSNNIEIKQSEKIEELQNSNIGDIDNFVEENGDSFVENEEESLEEDLLKKDVEFENREVYSDIERATCDTKIEEDILNNVDSNKDEIENINEKAIKEPIIDEKIVNNDSDNEGDKDSELNDSVENKDNDSDNDDDLTKTVDIIFDDFNEKAKEENEEIELKNEIDEVEEDANEIEEEVEEEENCDAEEENIEETEEDGDDDIFSDKKNTDNEQQVSKEVAEQDNDQNESPPEQDEYSSSLQDEEELINTVLALASLDGLISISEVQSLFEYGYVQAKRLLDKIVDIGKLTPKEDGQSYKFLKK